MKLEMINSQRLIKIFLIAAELVVGITAILGGYGLIFNDGMGLPSAWLSGTPFSSYFWPGVILALVVGGTNISAAVLVLRNHRYSLEMSAVAAFGLLIWLFVEVYMLPHSSMLQIIYFSLGIFILTLTMFSFKKIKMLR